jgi:hypothetical protein
MTVSQTFLMLGKIICSALFFFFSYLVVMESREVESRIDGAIYLIVGFLWLSLGIALAAHVGSHWQ